MKIINEKANYPFTYGDKNADELMISDYVVALMKTKKFQNYTTALFFAVLSLGSYAQPSRAIPPEYGEAVNEMLNQVGENAPAVPPIGQIQGQVPAAQGNNQYVLKAMPIEQQRLIAAQQMGKMGPMPGMPIEVGGPTNPPAFYIPNKPMSGRNRAINTVAFTTSLGIVCLNAAWGEPVAIVMCASGLFVTAYKLGKEVVIFMAKNIQ